MIKKWNFIFHAQCSIVGSALSLRGEGNQSYQFIELEKNISMKRLVLRFLIDILSLLKYPRISRSPPLESPFSVISQMTSSCPCILAPALCMLIAHIPAQPNPISPHVGPKFALNVDYWTNRALSKIYITLRFMYFSDLWVVSVS